MDKKLLLFFVLLVLTGACTKIPPFAQNQVLKNKTYVYLFYETEEECIKNQPDPDFFINCYQQVDFLKDNKVRLILSDIIHDGNYRVEANEIILTFESNYEVPNGIMKFKFITPNLIYNLDNNTYWKRLKGKSVWN